MTNSWTETALGEVIELYDHERIPLSTQQRNQRQGEYPYYGASGIIDHIDDYIFDGRFLLISEDGANLVERKTPIAFFASGKFWVNNHAHVVRGIPRVADDYFLMSYIQFANISGYITGTAQPKLSQSNLKAIRLPLPPLPTQRKIAAVLSAYDDLIENNTRRIEILEEMARAIYREWFVEFRFPGHEGVEMVELELGLIPQGWAVKPLGDVTEVITKGTTPTTLGKQFTSEGINFIKVQSIDEQGNILDDKLTKIDDETHKLLKRSQLQERDILFSIAGAIGRVAAVPKRFLPANTNQALAIIRPSDLSFTAYLYRTLRSSEFLNYSLERVVQTAQANVSLSVLSSAPVIMPTKIMVDDFNKHLTPITTLVDTLREKNANLRQTRDLLLPKLISGEIDVSDLDINTDAKE